MSKKSDKKTSGTTPGVDPRVPAPKIVNMLCKRCKNTEMEEINLPGNKESGNRTYRCLSCKNMTDIMVGGSFSL